MKHVCQKQRARRSEDCPKKLFVNPLVWLCSGSSGPSSFFRLATTGANNPEIKRFGSGSSVVVVVVAEEIDGG